MRDTQKKRRGCIPPLEDIRTNLVHNHRRIHRHSMNLRDTQKKRMGFMLLFEDITTPPENLP